MNRIDYAQVLITFFSVDAVRNNKGCYPQIIASSVLNIN